MRRPVEVQAVFSLVICELQFQWILTFSNGWQLCNFSELFFLVNVSHYMMTPNYLCPLKHLWSSPIQPLLRRSSSPALLQEPPMQYLSPPFQTTLPPQNSHMTVVPTPHWPQQQLAQAYGSHVAEGDYHQAPRHSTPVSEELYEDWPFSQAVLW